MLKLWSQWNKSRKWHWVGTVDARTEWVDAKSKDLPPTISQAYYALYERGDGKRKYEKTGERGNSPYAIRKAHSVQLWINGGPMPELCEAPYTASHSLTNATSYHSWR
jgi:hypothetical protein